MENLTLGEICLKITDGSHNPPKGIDKGKLMLSSRNITENGLNLQDVRYISPEDFIKEDKRTSVTTDDILLTIVGTVGRVLLVDSEYPKFTLQRSVGVLKPDKERVFPDFMAYSLKSAEFQRKLTAGSKGVAQKGIYLKDIRSLKIPLPPLPEQKRIAAILDAADAYRQKTKALLTKYDELAQSLFLEMFGDPVRNEKGWERVSLMECYVNGIEGTKCGPFGSALKKHEYTNRGIPVWTMFNIINGQFNYDGCLFISPDKFKDLKGYECFQGDVIISRAGTVGKMCVVKYSGKSIISTNLIRLRLDENLLLPMIFSLLMNNWGARVARLRTGEDGSFTHMSTGVLNKIKIPLPPIDLQNQFAERIQAIEKQKAQAQRSMEKAEELFQSLLQRAFKGSAF